jgi:hypothetical protein
MSFGNQGAGFRNQLLPFFQAGKTVIINKSGLFVYNGIPALGNLVGSISAAPGIDKYGNVYAATMSSYQGNNVASLINAQVAFTDTLFTVNPATIGLATITALTSSIGLSSGNSVLGVVTGSLILVDANGGFIANVPMMKFGGTILAEFASAGGQLLVAENTTAAPSNSNSQIINAAVGDNAFGIMVFGDTFNRLRVNSDGKILWGPGNATQDTNLYRASASQLQTDNEFNWTSPGGTVYAAQGSTTANLNVNTVTAATLGNLTNQTIPASDVSVGSVYKLRAFGQGTWGSTQQQLTFEATLGGTILCSCAIAATAFAASAIFDWEAEVTLACKTTGSGGTWNANVRVLATQQTNASTGLTAAANEVAVNGNNGVTPVAVSTTAANVFELGCFWAATVGAPTISKTTGWLEKTNG